MRKEEGRMVNGRRGWRKDREHRMRGDEEGGGKDGERRGRKEGGVNGRRGGRKERRYSQFLDDVEHMLGTHVI
jgi:hypothetical protein